MNGFRIKHVDISVVENFVPAQYSRRDLLHAVLDKVSGADEDLKLGASQTFLYNMDMCTILSDMIMILSGV
jgi:hypothetical protein